MSSRRPCWKATSGKTGQESLIEGIAPEDEAAPTAGKHHWPKALSEQVRAVRAALAEQPRPATAAQVAKVFQGAQTKRVTSLLQTLDALGQSCVTEDGRSASV